MRASYQRLTLIVAALIALNSFSTHAFELTDIGGGKQKLADFKGKWVVVNHWATWCTPCLVELPDLEEFQYANKDRVVVIGVVTDAETSANVKPLLTRTRVTFPTVLGGKKHTRQFAALRAVPTSFIYDPSGKLVETTSGALDIEALEGKITKVR
jgi:thiol-disulfide isomerase/thioredoxin